MCTPTYSTFFLCAKNDWITSLWLRLFPWKFQLLKKIERWIHYQNDSCRIKYKRTKNITWDVMCQSARKHVAKSLPFSSALYSKGVKIDVLHQSCRRCVWISHDNNSNTSHVYTCYEIKHHTANLIWKKREELPSQMVTHPNEFVYSFCLILNDVLTDEKTACFSGKIPLVWNVWYILHAWHHHLKHNKTEMKSHFNVDGFNEESQKAFLLHYQSIKSYDNVCVFSFFIALQIHELSILVCVHPL